MSAPARTDAVRKRLETLLPAERAGQLLAELLAEAKLASVGTADDQLAIAEALIRRRGVFAALGRALKIEAIFSGAVER